MNPHSLHLLVDYLMALYKEILIESLKIWMWILSIFLLTLQNK
jgi:hypothetical protein